MSILWWFIISIILMPIALIIFALFKGLTITGKIKQHDRAALELLEKTKALTAQSDISPEDVVSLRQKAQKMRGEFIDYAMANGMRGDGALSKMLHDVNSKYREIETTCMHALGRLKENK